MKRLFDACRFTYWNDINASGLMASLKEMRDGGKASAYTSNMYLTAAKSFCGWMVRDGRAVVSPLDHLQGVNARAAVTRERRALSLEEIRWLLDATRRGPERAGMGGEERALLYRLVIETGLRSNEVASLTRGSFDLEARTVTVSAADSKHRREDVLPIRADMAAALEGFLRLKAPAAKAFGMTRNRPMSEAVKADLRSARAAYLKAASAPQERRQRARTSFCAYKDGSGRVCDFHGLRHTAGSLLAAAGVHPKTAQTIMRHSDINLTLSRYTHTFREQESAAVESLPDLDKAPAGEAAKATGTDGAADSLPDFLPVYLPRRESSGDIDSARMIQPALKGGEAGTRMDAKFQADLKGKRMEPGAGIGPATCALRMRRSTVEPPGPVATT